MPLPDIYGHLHASRILRFVLSWEDEQVVNERLRRAMLHAGYSVETLAEAAGVTGKSVQRWVAGEVTPFSRTRFRVAALLGEDEGYL